MSLFSRAVLVWIGLFALRTIAAESSHRASNHASEDREPAGENQVQQVSPELEKNDAMNLIHALEETESRLGKRRSVGEVTPDVE